MIIMTRMERATPIFFAIGAVKTEAIIVAMPPTVPLYPIMLLEKPRAAIRIEISCVPRPKATPTAPIVAVAAIMARHEWFEQLSFLSCITKIEFFPTVSDSSTLWHIMGKDGIFQSNNIAILICVRAMYEDSGSIITKLSYLFF